MKTYGIADIIVKFDTYISADGFPEAIVTLDRDVDNIEVMTPPQEDYTYIANEDSPSWEEVSRHESAWEDYLIEDVLTPIADDLTRIIAASLAYCRAGGNLNDITRMIGGMD